MQSEELIHTLRIQPEIIEKIDKILLMEILVKVGYDISTISPYSNRVHLKKKIRDLLGIGKIINNNKKYETFIINNEINYNDASLSELKDIAKKYGIKNYSHKNISELKSMLNQYERGDITPELVKADVIKSLLNSKARTSKKSILSSDDIKIKTLIDKLKNVNNIL